MKLALIFIGFPHPILHLGQSINNIHKIIPVLYYIFFWRKAPVLNQMEQSDLPRALPAEPLVMLLWTQASRNQGFWLSWHQMKKWCKYKGRTISKAAKISGTCQFCHASWDCSQNKARVEQISEFKEIKRRWDTETTWVPAICDSGNQTTNRGELVTPSKCSICMITDCVNIQLIWKVTLSIPETKMS